ncbi:MAG: amidohydrolase [Candidatus Methanomethylophilaceae archaeon]|nr:amidohydrolase [Candidatus Methanomethylophilaceae archaeon]
MEPRDRQEKQESHPAGFRASGDGSGGVPVLDRIRSQRREDAQQHPGVRPLRPRIGRIYRICSDKGLPVTFHCGEVSRVRLNGYADISRIENAIASHEDVTFVLTHLAEGDPATVFRLADRYRNIVFDTSIAFSGEHCIHRIHDDFWEDDRNAAEAFRRIGCERVAFGSDYPFGNPISDVRRILGLDLTRDEKRRILGANTLALYGIS